MKIEVVVPEDLIVNIQRTNEKLVLALAQIAALVTSTESIQVIYETIHQIINTVMPAKNVAIVLLNEQEQTLQFDYFFDEKDGRSAQGRIIPMGQGMSSYVIKKKQAYLFTSQDITDLVNQGEMVALGTLAASWMGIPIQYKAHIEGLVIVQSYDQAQMYNTSDLQIMQFVAAQLAILFDTRKVLQLERDGRITIEKQKHELESLLKHLKSTQEELVQKEKMASLGRLVAGVAHEVNTPLGICLTAISNLNMEYLQFSQLIQQDAASENDLTGFLTETRDSCIIIENNLRRAASLIASFKTIAVDQSSEESRELVFHTYIEEVLQSLKPMLKNKPVQIHFHCPETICMKCNAGAISQIFTNLINNSILHGFDGRSKGNIYIDAQREDEFIHIQFRDDGNGMSKEQLAQLFEPFYTTKRGQGGSGLGAHLIFNLVTQSLQGKVSVSSEPGQGLCYQFRIPLFPYKS